MCLPIKNIVIHAVKQDRQDERQKQIPFPIPCAEFTFAIIVSHHNPEQAMAGHRKQCSPEGKLHSVGKQVENILSGRKTQRYSRSVYDAIIRLVKRHMGIYHEIYDEPFKEFFQKPCHQKRCQQITGRNLFSLPHILHEHDREHQNGPEQKSPEYDSEWFNPIVILNI